MLHVRVLVAPMVTISTSSTQGECAAVTGGGHIGLRLSQKREGLHEKTSFRQKIACQNGGHLESASWRLELEARRRRAAAGGSCSHLAALAGPPST